MFEYFQCVTFLFVKPFYSIFAYKSQYCTETEWYFWIIAKGKNFALCVCVCFCFSHPFRHVINLVHLAISHSGLTPPALHSSRPGSLITTAHGPRIIPLIWPHTVHIRLDTAEQESWTLQKFLSFTRCPLVVFCLNPRITFFPCNSWKCLVYSLIVFSLWVVVCLVSSGW